MDDGLNESVAIFDVVYMERPNRTGKDGDQIKGIGTKIGRGDQGGRKAG